MIYRRSYIGQKNIEESSTENLIVYNGRLSRQNIVNILSKAADFSMSLIKLQKKYDFDPESIRSFLHQHPDLFGMKNGFAIFKPQIELCDQYNSQLGCRKNCKKLHICSSYVLGDCKNSFRNCSAGHRWKTSHNDPILRNFHLHKHPFSLIQTIVSINSITIPALTEIKICELYNNKKCNNLRCKDLHICIDLLAGKCLNKSQCNLNHNIFKLGCKEKIGSFGVSTNEAPRDVIKNLIRDSPDIKSQIQMQDRNIRKYTNPTQGLYWQQAGQKRLQDNNKINPTHHIKISSKKT